MVATYSTAVRSGEASGGGENEHGRKGRSTGGGMDRDVSQTSPGEGISPGQAGSCLARPRRSPATCLPAWRGKKTHVPPLGWAGLLLGQVRQVGPEAT